MKNFYKSENFTKDDLKNFDRIKKHISGLPAGIDVINFLMDVLSDLEGYVLERLIESGKTELILKKNKITNRMDLEGILTRVKQYSEFMILDERLFLFKIEKELQHQFVKMDLNIRYPVQIQPSLLKNPSVYQSHFSNKDNIIWLGEKEKLALLINLLQNHSFIDHQPVENVLTIFCNSKGELFSDLPRTAIRWCSYKTELIYITNLLRSNKYNLVADKEIWVRISKNFIDKNSQPLNPRRLSSDFQKCKPKNNAELETIAASVKLNSIAKN